MASQIAVSHDFEEETFEAKARWFHSLSLTERMDVLCMFTDLVVGVNPKIMEQKDAKSVAGRVLVLCESGQEGQRVSERNERLRKNST